VNDKFDAAIRRFDQENGRDPNQENDRPRELLYAERLTGYHVGGISPFGQKKTVPTVLEELALVFDEVYLNGGQRGLQVKMAPGDIVRVLNAAAADVIA